MSKILYKQELIDLISNTKSCELDILFSDLLSDSEYDDIILRYQIIKLLRLNMPHRKISQMLGVSIAKVTRGSKLLKSAKYFK